MSKKTIVPLIKSQGIKTKLVPWIMELAPKVNGKQNGQVAFTTALFSFVRRLLNTGSRAM